MTHTSRHDDGLFSEQATRYLLGAIPSPAMQRILTAMVGDRVIRIGAVSRVDTSLVLEDVLVVSAGRAESADKLVYCPKVGDEFVELRAEPASISVGGGDLTLGGLALELVPARNRGPRAVARLRCNPDGWDVDPVFWPERIAVGADPRSQAAHRRLVALWPTECVPGVVALRLADPDSTTWADLLPVLLGDLRLVLPSGGQPSKLFEALAGAEAAVAGALIELLDRLGAFPPTLRMAGTTLTRAAIARTYSAAENALRVHGIPGCVPVVLLNAAAPLRVVHGRCTWAGGSAEFVLRPGSAAAATTDVPASARWFTIALSPREAGSHVRVACYRPDHRLECVAHSKE